MKQRSPTPAALAASMAFYAPTKPAEPDTLIRCDACGKYRPCRRAQAAGDGSVLLCAECADE